MCLNALVLYWAYYILSIFKHWSRPWWCSRDGSNWIKLDENGSNMFKHVQKRSCDIMLQRQICSIPFAYSNDASVSWSSILAVRMGNWKNWIERPFKHFCLFCGIHVAVALAVSDLGFADPSYITRWSTISSMVSLGGLPSLPRARLSTDFQCEINRIYRVIVAWDQHVNEVDVKPF
jgi:hypothetical protein